MTTDDVPDKPEPVISFSCFMCGDVLPPDDCDPNALYRYGYPACYKCTEGGPSND